MVPRLGSSKLVSGWITLTVVASIVAAVDGGWLATWAGLAPSRIWRGELWRLGTWVFIEHSALGLVLTCASIYKFAGELAPRWGDRRLRRFMIEIIGGAAVVTCVLALIFPDLWFMHRLGGWAVGDVLAIAWARQYPDRDLVLYGLVRLHGPNLIAATIGITCVFALFGGVLGWTPELVVCAAVYWYPSERLTRG